MTITNIIASILISIHLTCIILVGIKTIDFLDKWVKN